MRRDLAKTSANAALGEPRAYTASYDNRLRLPSSPMTLPQWSPPGANRPPPAAVRANFLVVGDAWVAALCAASPLKSRFAVEHTPTMAEALARLSAGGVGILVIELALPDGDGDAVCRAAAAACSRPVMLIMTSEPRRVPNALAAGCDSVLLKPFAPNLLFSRLGRLARDLQIRGVINDGRPPMGTNRPWPRVVCPACSLSGAVSFDGSSLRRWWYACMACQNVWLGRRQE